MFYWSLIVVNFTIHQVTPSHKTVTDFVIEKLTNLQLQQMSFNFIIVIIEHSSFNVIDHVTSIINHKIGLLWMGLFIKLFALIDYQCCCYLHVLWYMDIYYQWFLIYIFMQRRLSPGMCSDDAYVKINCMAP